MGGGENNNTNLPICYFHYQVGIIYNCWIFSKFMIGDDMLHELFWKHKKKKTIS